MSGVVREWVEDEERVPVEDWEREWSIEVRINIVQGCFRAPGGTLVVRVSLNLYFRSGTFSVTLKLEIIDRMDERSNN